MSLIVKDISYIHADREPLFAGLSFSIADRQKVALVGNNGSGKSTLLRILAGQLRAASGSFSFAEIPYYVPQHFGQYDGMTVAGALGIEDRWRALRAILAGEATEANYTLLNEDWQLEERATAALASWGMERYGLDHPMWELSGGEKTKIFLAGIDVHEAGFVLMDEPSNHLDAATREKLYDLVRHSSAAMLLVSHDRALLNLLDTTLELKPDRVVTYGGNYEFYKDQKIAARQALENRLGEKEKEVRKARTVAREAVERKERRDARGAAKKIREGVPRIMMNTIRNRAEMSNSKLKQVHAGKMEDITEEIRDIRSRLRTAGDIRIALASSGLHAGKILVTAKGVNFGYTADHLLWEEPLFFQLRSGERLALKGRNGSGKTTLLRLILGELEPTEGELVRTDFTWLYVDQEYSLIDNKLTLYEQVERFNRRNLPEHILKTELHRFLFPKETWDKKCSSLSGGEKMKLIFCCLLVSDASPDLFILDEPTNNLDIESLEIVTASLNAFDGTLLVISHDRYFLEEIGVCEAIDLDGLK